MARLLGPGKARSATRRPCAWIAQRHRQTVGEPWWLSKLDRRDLPAVFAALKHCRGSAASSCRLARVGPEVRVEPGCRFSPNLPIASLPAHYDAARSRGPGPRARFGNKLRAWPSCTSTRSEEHTSELQSLMRISYAVFCL